MNICKLLIILLGASVSCVAPNITSNNVNSNTLSNIVVGNVKSENVDLSKTDVKLEVNIEANVSLKPKVSGITNLPNDTEIMISITGKTANYNGQDKTTVKNGRFESTEFSLKSDGLPVGQYEVRVTMPISSVQPPSVRKIIGENGENLRGSLVQQGDLGTTVSVEKPFQLQFGGKIVFSEDKTKVSASKKQSEQMLTRLSELEQQGRGMEVLRNTRDLDKIEKCGVLMRELQPIADSLRSEAGNLPSGFSVLLTSAATEMKLCVSCMSSALSNCKEAKSYLEEAKKVIKK